VAYNLTSVFLGLPKIVPGALRVILVLDGFAIGAIEEFFFRGVAFLGRGQATPKRTVLITAISFSVIHFVGLTTGVPIHNVLHVMIGALPIGILFGVIRLATGSIAWCICLHGAIDASAYLAGGGWRGWELANSTLFLVSVSSATILFFAHPKMRKSQARVI
jgi:membrane protease YdiL (CAAX protease family)